VTDDSKEKKWGHYKEKRKSTKDAPDRPKCVKKKGGTTGHNGTGEKKDGGEHEDTPVTEHEKECIKT